MESLQAQLEELIVRKRDEALRCDDGTVSTACGRRARDLRDDADELASLLARQEQLLKEEKDDQVSRVATGATIPSAGTTAKTSNGSSETLIVFVWKCKTCGCLWRDNLDQSVSLLNVAQKSCDLCEGDTSAACESHAVRLEPWRELFEKAESMLTCVEWVRQSGGSKYACPFCHGIADRDGGPGHTPDCEWSALIVGRRTR